MNAPIDVTNIRIETPRLILRAWQQSDLRDFYEYAHVDGVGQMAGWQPHESIEKSREILSHFISEKKTLALELKESGKVIGSLGLEQPTNPARDADWIEKDFCGREFGYVLSKDYWGQGLMPEAVKAVMTYCFEVLNWDYVTCGHYIWNRQSQRVIEKSGFQFVKAFSYQTKIGTEEAGKLYICYNPNKMR